MALPSTALFASFDVTDKTQEYDISPFLAKALILDFNLLGRGMSMDFGAPVGDTIHYWNYDALNSDQGTVSGSITSTATSLVLSSGHGARFAAGDQFYDGAANSTEVIQITAVSTDTLTIVRGFNSTVAAVIADGATIYRMPVAQEGSDIAADKSVAPGVYSNPTQIVPGNDLQITGSQLARNMSTDALKDYFGHQLANRMIEWNRVFSRNVLYSEKNVTAAGSDTSLRSFGGMRYWARDNSGVVDSASGAMSWANLNTQNLVVVNKGETGLDTLLTGPDLTGTIATFDSTLRRLRESDTQVGYTVQEIQLANGNIVELVQDGRVKTGDYFLYKRANVRALPLQTRAMISIVPRDAVDGRKGRILGEWTLEVQHPETLIYGRNKT